MLGLSSEDASEWAIQLIASSVDAKDLQTKCLDYEFERKLVRK